MKLIRRTSFTKFTTIPSPISAQYVKVIDTKTHRKVIVKNPEYIPQSNIKPWRTLRNY
jgi:hypothetical protein